MAKGRELVSGAARSASYQMILQVSVRILTFVLNAFIIQHLSKEILGVANVRLALLNSSILFVSREGFRRACLNKSPSTTWAQVVNLVWCVIPISVIWSVIFTSIWLYALTQPDPIKFPNFTATVVCFAAMTIFELAAEPLVIISQSFLFVRLKVLMEALYNLVRCVVIMSLVVLRPQLGLLVFSAAQIACSLVYLIVYYAYFYFTVKKTTKKDDTFPFKSPRQFFPQKLKDEAFIDSSLALLVWSFSKQSFLKQILTEGERYVMTIFDMLSFADQGIYDIVNNLGSMAARFLFLPIEESGYLFFSKALQRGVTAKDEAKESVDLCYSMLRFLLRVTLLIGLTVMVFGYSYSQLALDIYGGHSLSLGQGPTLLRWHALYIAIIAVNGVTECFVFAAMSKEEVDSYNKKMVLFSVLFLLSSWYLTGIFGGVGFILANSLNMLARIIHSLYFIQKYFQGTSYNPLQSLIPSPVLIAVLLSSLLITVTSQASFCCERGLMGRVIHILVGGFCLIVEFGIIYLTEIDLVNFIKDHFITGKSNKQE